MIVSHDPRSIVRARSALNDARNALATASTRTTQIGQCPLVEAVDAINAAQYALVEAWDAVAYADAELAAYLGGD